MNNELKPSEQRTLEALMIALSNFDKAPSEDFREQLNTLVESLKQNDYSYLDKIPEIVSPYPELNQYYQDARLKLEEQYTSKEKNKFYVDSSGTLTLDNIAITDFLTADDFKAFAKRILKKVKKAETDFMEVWKKTLSATEAKTELKAVSILRELDTKPLMIEDLAYKLNLDFEEAKKLVYHLWKEKKIDTLTGGIIQMIFPQLRGNKELDENAYLTLTSWGYFYLHPIIGRR